MPFGGKYQLAPAEGMVAKIPVLAGDTTTGTIMTYGYNPLIGKWSPFHGALYAIVESCAKVVALGGDYSNIRLTLQEYFEKLGKEPEKWGKPFAALLGAFYAQMKLSIPAIGGKDSMSGTFKDMNVPPTLVSFAVDTVDTRSVVSNEFKCAGSKVVIIPLMRDDNNIPDFKQLDRNYSRIHQLVKGGKVLSAQTVRGGGIAEAVSKMCFGNMIGFAFGSTIDNNELFAPSYGTMILEIPGNEAVEDLFEGIEFSVLGSTTEESKICINNTCILLDDALKAWENPLEKIFPTRAKAMQGEPVQYSFDKFKSIKSPCVVAKPRIFMPVFPGTNCEYDTARAFEKAGGVVDTFVIKNLSSTEIEKSIETMVKKIDQSQIIMIPGGFSGGDEPEGSGKFIATAFRNPYMKDAVMRLLKQRDGLMLGICNGFQALVKLGLVPYGEIRDMDDECPTLTFNTIGRHASCYVNTMITSTLSPWLAKTHLGDIYSIPVSHGEGRFAASAEVIDMMAQNGQIATQYVDSEGRATYDIRFNPNGSIEAIEGITSPDGRVLGKMGHSERKGACVGKNIPGEKEQMIFEAGVGYFK